MNYEIHSLEIGILRYLQSLNRVPAFEIIYKQINLLHKCSFEDFLDTVELLARDGAITVIFDSNGELEKISRITAVGGYLLNESMRRKLNAVRSGDKRKLNKSLTTTYINNFYAAIEGSNLAFGDNAEQNLKNGDTLNYMVKTVKPLLKTIIEEDDTPEKVQERTIAILDKLEAFQNQELSLSSFEGMLGEYIVGIAGWMTTPYIVLAATRVGQILDAQCGKK